MHLRDADHGRQSAVSHVHVEQAKNPVYVIHPDPDAFAALPLLQPELMHGTWHRRQLAAVIERRAMDVAY